VKEANEGVRGVKAPLKLKHSTFGRSLVNQNKSTIQDFHFTGLSRTSSFNLQNFPGPKSFFRTFYILENQGKNSRTFPLAWEPRTQYKKKFDKNC